MRQLIGVRAFGRTTLRAAVLQGLLNAVTEQEMRGGELHGGDGGARDATGPKNNVQGVFIVLVAQCRSLILPRLASCGCSEKPVWGL